jgi:hypothetical protein
VVRAKLGEAQTQGGRRAPGRAHARVARGRPSTLKDAQVRLPARPGGRGRVAPPKHRSEGVINTALWASRGRRKDLSSIATSVGMFWLPVALRDEVPPVSDRIFIDGTRDFTHFDKWALSPHGLRFWRRICAVGDDRRAIYGFAAPTKRGERSGLHPRSSTPAPRAGLSIPLCAGDRGEFRADVSQRHRGYARGAEEARQGRLQAARSSWRAARVTIEKNTPPGGLNSSRYSSASSRKVCHVKGRRARR